MDELEQEVKRLAKYDDTTILKLLHEKDIKEIERLNNIINETEKEIDRLLERQYESERFAKENGFNTYLPAKENLLCVKNKLQKLKGGDNSGNNSFKVNCSSQ